MAGNGIIHVVAVSAGAPDTATITSASAIIGKDAYETRLLLSGGIPRLLAQFHSSAAARDAAQALTELGLTAFVCPDSELRRPQKLFTARNVKFSDGEVSFRNSSGGTSNVKVDDVFLILKGIWRIPEIEETIETKRKLNLTATLITGGIPIFSKTIEKTTQTTLREEFFLRIYTHESLDPVVQMSQSSMVHTYLSSSTTPSSAASFNATVAKLQSSCAQAIFDDRLSKPPRSDTASARDSDVFRTNCRLLCLYSRNIKSPAA